MYVHVTFELGRYDTVPFWIFDNRWPSETCPLTKYGTYKTALIHYIIFSVSAKFDFKYIPRKNYNRLNNCLSYVKKSLSHRAKRKPLVNGWVTELCNVPNPSLLSKTLQISHLFEGSLLTEALWSCVIAALWVWTNIILSKLGLWPHLLRYQNDLWVQHSISSSHSRPKFVLSNIKICQTIIKFKSRQTFPLPILTSDI